MPEGDTVWLTAQRLHQALVGQRLARTDFRVPTLATTNLAGWNVTEVASRGKHLLLRLESPDGRLRTLRTHLRMDGTWRLFGPGAAWRGRPSHQVRVVLTTDTVTAVGFYLHDVALVPTDEEADLVGHLGPDLLGSDWDPDEAVRRLSADPGREIAPALLDQRNLAGIGNLYKCELLFIRRTWPWTPVRDVADLPEVVHLAHRLLDVNKQRWAQITTGSPHPAEATWVFGRSGKPCRRCGTRIRRDQQGTALEDRVTYWCPRCQPAP